MYVLLKEQCRHYQTMKIINNSDSLLHFSFNEKFLNVSKEINPTYLTDSSWLKKDDKILNLTYNISYDVNDHEKNITLISYKRRLEIECVIDVVKEAAEQVCRLKEGISSSMAVFLEQNTKSYFPLLNFRVITFTTREIDREAQAIDYATSQPPIKSLSEEDQNIIQRFGTGDMQIKLSIQGRDLS